MVLILILLSMVIMAAFTGYLADEKGYRQFEWMIIGFFFGPLGLIAAAGLPDKALRRQLMQGIDTHPQNYPPVSKSSMPLPPRPDKK